MFFGQRPIRRRGQNNPAGETPDKSQKKEEPKKP